MTQTRLTPKQKKLAGALLAAFLVLFTAAVCWYIGRPMVQFVSQPEKFRTWVNEQGVWGRIAFLAMQVLQVVVAVIPGEALELGAGYAFGAVEGTALCMLGTAAGGAAVFGLVRRFGLPLVELFFDIEKIRRLPILQKPRRLEALVFLVFFIPGTPKDLLTYAVGLTPIRFGVYFWLTLAARVPSIVTSTVGGSALGEQKYLFALLALAVTAAISGAGLLVWRAMQARREEGPQDVPKGDHSEKTS